MALDAALWLIGPSSHAIAEPAEVGQDRLLATWDAALRIGVVDTQHDVPPCSSAYVRLATALSALPRWSDPVGLGAKRTRTGSSRVDRDVTGLPGDPLEPAADRG